MLFAMLQGINDFLDRSGYAQTTQELYRYYLLHFAAWMGDCGLETGRLERDGLAAWLDAFGWQGDTRYAAACAVKAFLRYACGSAHPALACKVRRRKPRPQRTLTCAQVQALLESINTARASGVRNLALCRLLCDFSAAGLNAESADEGGCGCSTPGQRPAATWGALFLLVAGAGARARRRRRGTR